MFRTTDLKSLRNWRRNGIFERELTLTLYLAILLFAFTATITPGPNNIMIMTSGFNYGFKRSIPHLLGICFGFPAMVIMVGMGLGLVFAQHPTIHYIIKIVGIIYLIYLAWLIASAPISTLVENTGQPLTFIGAVLFQWVNPKAWVMITWGDRNVHNRQPKFLYSSVGDNICLPADDLSLCDSMAVLRRYLEKIS